jgi:hypothetical protein
MFLLRGESKKTSYQERYGNATTTWRRTITSEMEEMSFSMGQAQYVTKDRGR